MQVQGSSLQSPPIVGPHQQKRYYLVDILVLTIGQILKYGALGGTCWGPNDPIPNGFSASASYIPLQPGF